MRLINADKYKGKVIAYHYYSGVIKIKNVDDIPIAYDIDKVIEELEALRNIDICKNVKCSERSYLYCSECSQNLVVDKAIEIVKQGGVETDTETIRENANGYSKEDIELNRKAMYNKAIDDFSEKIKENISESLIWGMLVDSHKDNSFNDTSDKIVDYVIDTANEISEQLKAGGNDEMEK